MMSRAEAMQSGRWLLAIQLLLMTHQLLEANVITSEPDEQINTPGTPVIVNTSEPDEQINTQGTPVIVNPSEPDEQINTSATPIIVNTSEPDEPMTASPTPITLGPTKPSPEFFGRKGYRQYHANDSLVGYPVKCSRQEKLCFKYNLLYDPKSKRCVPFDVTPGCGTRIDRREYEHGSRHVVAAAAMEACGEPCPGHRMAFDGDCYPVKTAKDIFCACEGYDFTAHFFGGAECRCWTPLRAKAYFPPQPKEEGICVIPNLFFPIASAQELTGGALRSRPPRRLSCSAAQLSCFAAGRVLVAGQAGCAHLLRQGACPDGHVAALSATAAQDGRAEGVCVHERGGCPLGQRRHFQDGACRDAEELDLVWTPHRDVFGQFQVSDDDIKNRHSVQPFIKLAAVGEECVVDSNYHINGYGDDQFDPGQTIVYTNATDEEDEEDEDEEEKSKT